MKCVYNFIRCKNYLTPTMMPVTSQNVPQQKQFAKYEPENSAPYQPTSMANVYPYIHQNEIQTSDFSCRLYKPTAPPLLDFI